MSRQNPTVLGRWGSQGEGGTRVMGAPAYWKGPDKWRKDAADPVKGDGQRKRVFCLSLGDFFEDWKGPIMSHRKQVIGGKECQPALWYRDDKGICEVSETTVMGRNGERPATMDDLRRKVWPIIDRTGDWLDWLLLTKRPQNIPLLWDWPRPPELPDVDPGEPMRKHVWLGATASDQRTLELVWPHLSQCYPYSPCLWLSIEPLLGPLDLENIRGEDGYVYNAIKGEKRGTITRDVIPTGMLSWAVVGGESGAGARITDPDWVRSIRDKCDKRGIAFFHKQWGEHVRGDQLPETHETELMEIDEAAYYRLGKDKAGRLLDGYEWSQVPHVYH